MSAASDDERRPLLANDITSIPRVSHHAYLRRASGASLPPFHEGHFVEPESSISLEIWVVVPISLIGVLVANADGSLVIASSQEIASEFDSLFNAQWLVTSFGLATCASQPLYGKLSDIFGRKSNLIVAYTFFAGGCLLCGVASQFWHVIAGRAISGIGGAGMTALVSVIISDMVPVRDVAAWRSYVNVAATTGRALGGPVGGWLCDTLGWRWCFYGQVPLTIIGLLLILWKMPSKTLAKSEHHQTLSQKFRRVDIVGAVFLASAISVFLLTLDLLAREASKVLIGSLISLFTTLSVAFCLVERYFAKEPILPLRFLTTRPAVTSYLLAGFQIAAQFGLFYSTPLYYQVVSHSSAAQAGSRLVPAVIGNASAGLLAGWTISKTGRYKLLTVLASAVATLGYLLVTLRWRGTTSWYETSYIFLGGFGSGAIQSSSFIHLAANLEPEDMAIAGTTLYLAQNIFLLFGVQSSTTLLHYRLQELLNNRLKDTKDKAQIIRSAISSVRSIHLLPEKLKSLVIMAYVDGLTWTFGNSIVFAVLGLIVGLTIREQRLE